jgi:hypothetical protein
MQLNPFPLKSGYDDAPYLRVGLHNVILLDKSQRKKSLGRIIITRSWKN